MPPFIHLSLLLFAFISFNSAQSESELEFSLEEFTPLEEHSLSGYVPLDLTQAMSNAQIQGLLYIGVQKATQALVQEGSLPAGAYQVAHVQRVEQNQDVTDIQNYRFEVVVSNGQGGESSTIVFDMTYDPVQGSSEVTSSEVLGQEAEQEIEQETEQETEQEIEQESEQEAEAEVFLPVSEEEFLPSTEELALPTAEGELVLPTSEEELVFPASEEELVLPVVEEEQVLPVAEEEQVLPIAEEEQVLPASEEELVLPTASEEELVLPTASEEELVLPIAEEEQVLPAVEEEEKVLLGFVPLDLDQANSNPQIQGLLQIGVKNATGQAIQDGVLASGDYQVVKVVSIEENQDVPNVQDYHFNVEISTGGPETSNLTFEMTYDTSSGTSQVTAYNVQTNQPAPTEKYTPLDLNTISTNPQVQGLVYVGIQNVTQQAIQNNALPSSTYQVAQVNSVGQGSINNNDYQFNVSITNNQGTTADALFTLLYNNTTGGADITSYSIANLAIVTTPPVSNVTDNPATSVNITNPTVPMTNTSIPENITLPTTVATTPTIPVTPNTTYPENITLPTTTPTTVGTTTGGPSGATAGWIPVDVYSGQDPMAYQLGEYGYAYVITAANSAGQIPYSYYYVTSVNGAAKLVQGSVTYYYYDLTVADGYGNSAELIFTMSYDTVSGVYNVVNYNVQNVVRAY